jgi:hypothetical protein
MEQTREERCALAGLNVGQSAPHSDYTCIVPGNLLGLAKEEDWIVPHSEAAMSMGVAGKKIIVACRHRRTSDTRIVVQGEKGCGLAYGIESELLSHELTRQIEKVFGK